MLSLDHLTVSIEKKKILKDISYTFEEGKVYAIMGPNGSGKSTLASVVMGHPAYTAGKKSKIIYDKQDITNFSPDKRAKLGIFMSFQTPVTLSGINIYQLLLYALSGEAEPLEIRQKAQNYAKRLKINEGLLSRSLNEGFSGGEKKKMEVLQAAMLDPKLIIFDEIDTGVDVDAMREIARFIKHIMSKDKTFILITHYSRILKYLKPDAIIVLLDGRIAKVGDAKLANTIEKKGYENIGKK